MFSKMSLEAKGISAFRLPAPKLPIKTPGPSMNATGGRKQDRRSCCIRHRYGHGATARDKIAVMERLAANAESPRDAGFVGLYHIISRGKIWLRGLMARRPVGSAHRSRVGRPFECGQRCPLSPILASTLREAGTDRLAQPGRLRSSCRILTARFCETEVGHQREWHWPRANARPCAQARASVGID
jgi:hypothetical protein